MFPLFRHPYIIIIFCVNPAKCGLCLWTKNESSEKLNNLSKSTQCWKAMQSRLKPWVGLNPESQPGLSFYLLGLRISGWNPEIPVNSKVNAIWQSFSSAGEFNRTPLNSNLNAICKRFQHGAESCHLHCCSLVSGVLQGWDLSLKKIRGTASEMQILFQQLAFPSFHCLCTCLPLKTEYRNYLTLVRWLPVGWDHDEMTLSWQALDNCFIN